MNRTSVIAALSLLCLCTARAVEAPSAPDQQVLTLVKEIHAQQVQIAENEAAIDARLASVAEALRLARIYASRGGH